MMKQNLLKNRKIQFFILIIVPIIGVTILILLFLFVKNIKQQNIELEFTRVANERFAAIEASIDANIQVLESISAFYAASENVERDEFNKFVQPLLSNNPAIYALHWAPSVVSDERVWFEKAAQESGLSDFNIYDRAADGTLIPAGNSKEYFPIFYTEPANHSELALGFDLASSDVLKKEINRAQESGLMVATKRTVLKHVPEKQFGTQIIQPVYPNNINAKSSSHSENQLAGVILGIFNIGKIVTNAVDNLNNQGTHIHIFDQSAEPKDSFLYDYHSRLDSQKEAPPQNLDEAMLGYRLYTSATLDVGGRKWKLLCTPTSTFLEEHMAWYHWEGLLFSIIITCFTTYYLTNSYMQTQAKEKQVHKLKEIIASRDKEIAQRKEFQEQLNLAATVIENVIDGISITDAEGNIEQVNPSFTTITGYTAAEVLGKNPRILKSNRHNRRFYKNMWESLLAKGLWEGEIWNRRKNGETYPEWLSITGIKDKRGKTKHYVAVFHDITELKRSQKTLQYQANYDALTGLPNRLLFNDRLKSAIEQARRHAMRIGVLFLDLDSFKIINDSQGHYFGDQLLKQVADRLKSCCRDEDTVSRIYGDEFMLLARSLRKNEPAAAKLAERILNALKKPFIINNKEIFISASIGIALFPDDGNDIETLGKNADMAMYRAKRQGKNQICMYTDSMNHEVKRQLSLGNDLRRAMERDEFMVYYQPKVDVRSGQIAGMEALVRWKRRGKEMIPPNEFIPIAEDNGVIFPLGEWVISQACQMAKKGAAACKRDLHMAVNLSVRQFGQKNLIQIIEESLKQTGLSPNLLTIEITESIAIKDVNKTVKTLKKMKEMGLRISIDDFGTGYSSLYYLKKMPLSELKIDKSFIDDTPHDTDAVAIVNTILNLAKSLNLKTVAEGVETIEQLQFLSDDGCDEIQGYLFSKPISSSEMETLLIEDKRLLTMGDYLVDQVM